MGFLQGPPPAGPRTSPLIKASESNQSPNHGESSNADLNAGMLDWYKVRMHTVNLENAGFCIWWVWSCDIGSLLVRELIEGCALVRWLSCKGPLPLDVSASPEANHYRESNKFGNLPLHTTPRRIQALLWLCYIYSFSLHLLYWLDSLQYATKYMCVSPINWLCSSKDSINCRSFLNVLCSSKCI